MEFTYTTFRIQSRLVYSKHVFWVQLKLWPCSLSLLQLQSRVHRPNVCMAANFRSICMGSWLSKAEYKQAAKTETMFSSLRRWMNSKLNTGQPQEERRNWCVYSLCKNIFSLSWPFSILSLSSSCFSFKRSFLEESFGL